MTRTTVNHVDADRIDEAPPHGTAIVRPLRHVRAVREHDAAQSADPSEAAAESRSARAWAWALGESATAPVTDRVTAVPPSRSDIEAEITAADERLFRGDQENRADAAAIILRWLIGDDDDVPVEAENPGELVGGFGDVVRSPEQIAGILALAAEGVQRAAAQGRDLDADADARAFARQDADYLNGVMATLAWILGERAESPVSHPYSRELTTRDLKMERVRRRGRDRAVQVPLDGRPPPAALVRRRRQVHHHLATRRLDRATRRPGRARALRPGQRTARAAPRRPDTATPFLSAGGGHRQPGMVLTGIVDADTSALLDV